VQPDGKIVIGGAFTSYNGDDAASDKVMRLNADGTRDSTFNAGGAGADDRVYAVAVQPDGKIVIGGDFTSYNGEAAETSDSIMRLNADGTRDPTFNPGGAGADGGVQAVAVQADGKIIIGGNFTSYNGDAAANDRVMRLNADGTRDATFNAAGMGAASPVGGSTVSAVALQPDGKIVIGGFFTSYNGDAAATSDKVMRLNADGTRDASFNAGGAGADNAVLAVALQPDGKIVISGLFTSYNGDAAATSDRVMRLNADGTRDSTFNPGGAGANGTGYAVAVQRDGKIVIGGDFTSYNGDAAASDRVMRLEGDFFLTWPAGDATDKAILLPIINDGTPEDDESLKLTLKLMSGGAALGSPSSSTLTILDDDGPRAVPPKPAPSTNEDTPVQITLTGTKRSNTPLTFTVTDMPDHGTLGALSGSSCSFDGSNSTTTCTATVTYTPNANYNGMDSFKFKVNDGTTDSAEATVSISVGAVNDPPTANGQSVTTNEDQAKAITLTGSDTEGSTLTFSVVTQPAHGGLTGTPPHLTYTPAANYNGSDSFKFKVNDGQADSNTVTVSITILAVNDAPSFVEGSDQTVSQGSGPQTVANWATSISAGPADESGQSLTFMVSNNNNSLFASQPAVSANGTLSYTPASNPTGSATVTVTLQDKGGTANNGHDTSAPQTFTITVTATPTPTPTPTATPTSTPTATPTPSPTPSTVLNLSTRERVEVGDNVLIGGFILSGEGTKKVVVRAIGPSLAEKQVTDVLDDPVLELHGRDGSLIVANDNWKDTQQQEIEDSQLAPTDDRESAIVATLMPGSYTAIVRGKNETTGVALVEIYDVSSSADSYLGNLSTRGLVQTDDNVMIGGFTLGAFTGETHMVVRAIGPSLVAFGIANPLQDPTVDIRDQNGASVASNDNWLDDPSHGVVEHDALAPNDERESAIAVTLPAGRYTVIVSGKDRGTGVGLVEMYNLK
jgi:uncharacterized delta-60 repeat protein